MLAYLVKYSVAEVHYRNRSALTNVCDLVRSRFG